MTETLVPYTFITDTLKNTITMHSEGGKKDSLNLKFEYKALGRLKLFGILENDTLNISFKKKSLDSLPLTSRSFHWINERPYNQ
jgi:hypothetical protein